MKLELETILTNGLSRSIERRDFKSALSYKWLLNATQTIDDNSLADMIPVGGY